MNPSRRSETGDIIKHYPINAGINIVQYCLVSDIPKNPRLSNCLWKMSMECKLFLDEKNCCTGNKNSIAAVYEV